MRKYDFPIIIPTCAIRVWHCVSMLYYKMRTSALAWIWGVKHGEHVRFQGKTIIRTRHLDDICLGNNVVFNSQKSTNLVGLLGPTILDTLGGGQIKIGDNTGFSSVVMSSRSSITIGCNVKVGGNVRIFDHDFHSLDPEYRRTSEDRDHIRSRSVIIDDDCFIGTNAIILKGTHLGKRTIVAAGSVVFGLHTPADSLVKGNPAVVIERR